MQKALLGETLIDIWARTLFSSSTNAPPSRSRYAGLLDVVAEGPVVSIDAQLPYNEPWLLNEQRWNPSSVVGGQYTDPLWRVLISADDVSTCEARLESLALGFRYVLRMSDSDTPV
jgi:hypothetical protein